jgi:hypothetical protein
VSPLLDRDHTGSLPRRALPGTFPVEAITDKTGRIVQEAFGPRLVGSKSAERRVMHTFLKIRTGRLRSWPHASHMTGLYIPADGRWRERLRQVAGRLHDWGRFEDRVASLVDLFADVAGVGVD